MKHIEVRNALAWVLFTACAVTVGCRGKQPSELHTGEEGNNASDVGGMGAASEIGLGSFEGNLETITDECIVGWAWDSKRPNVPIKVAIFSDGKPLAIVRADQSRNDLMDAKKGDGRHGLIFPTPALLKDGEVHNIVATIAETKAIIGKMTLVLPKAP